MELVPDDQQAFYLGEWGRIVYEEEHWFTACPCLCIEFRDASVKLMSQPSIKEALTSLNYRYCKIKYAGLFGGNNVTGWRSPVIFSMLLARGLDISQPHLQLFLTCAAYEMIVQFVHGWKNSLWFYLQHTVAGWHWYSADCRSDAILHKRSYFLQRAILNCLKSVAEIVKMKDAKAILCFPVDTTFEF